MQIATWAARGRWLTLFSLALGACRERSASARRSATDETPATATSSSCAGDSLRPVAAAPAEGLWRFEEPSGTRRVSAMVGPPNADSGRARITRRVETLELRANAHPLHHALDTASVSLERLPPLPGPSSSPRARDTSMVQLAAAYAVTPFVVLASYQPCAASEGGREEPRIRYVRRDAKGRVVTDVILWRAPDEAERGAR